MNNELIAAVLLQTIFIYGFMFILIPFPFSARKVLPIMIGVISVSCITAIYLFIVYGTFFLMSYGLLFIGLPIHIMLYFFSSIKGMRYVFVILTTVLAHQMISLLLTVLRIVAHNSIPIYYLFNFILFSALLYGAYRVRDEFHKIIFAYRNGFVCLSLILGLLLFMFRVFTPIIDEKSLDYDLLLIEALIYALLILLYFYITVSFHSLSQKYDAEHTALSLQIQIEEAQNQISLLQEVQEKAIIYRHDLRHHFALINELLDAGEIQKIKDYLFQTLENMQTVPKHFCMNETADLIISAYSERAKKVDIELDVVAQIPQELPIDSTELCSLLSNVLENSIIATQKITDNRSKKIKLVVKFLDKKLLLSAENPYSGEIVIKNGIPQSQNKGHGFGTKSIKAIVEKYNGLFSFDTKNGIFSIRIVI